MNRIFGLFFVTKNGVLECHSRGVGPPGWRDSFRLSCCRSLSHCCPHNLLILCISDACAHAKRAMAGVHSH